MTVQAGFAIAVGGVAGLAEGAIGSASIGSSAESYREYPSFSSFKRGEGPAGEGMDWHHIVEQNPANQAQFTAEQLHSTDNLTAIPKAAHREINGIYSRSSETTPGLRYRDEVSAMSFEDQSAIGESLLNKVMKKYSKK